MRIGPRSSGVRSRVPGSGEGARPVSAKETTVGSSIPVGRGADRFASPLSRVGLDVLRDDLAVPIRVAHGDRVTLPKLCPSDGSRVR